MIKKDVVNLAYYVLLVCRQSYDVSCIQKKKSTYLISFTEGMEIGAR